MPARYHAYLAPTARSPAVTGFVIAGKATPRGAFPHMKRAGDFLFVSGISARRADNSIAGVSHDAAGVLRLDVQEQTRAVIENIADVLHAAGAALDDLVEITTFLISMDDFDGYNAVYAEFFDHQGPARTTVAVRALPHPHLLIEMRAIAFKPA